MKYIEFPLMQSFDAIVAGMTQRSGGVAETPFGNGHVGILSNSYLEAGTENFQTLVSAVGGCLGQTYATEQVHGDEIAVIRKKDGKLQSNRPERAFGEQLPGTIVIEKTDGMITNEPFVLLTTFYADCTPILFFDPVHKVIAAIHSGWQGTRLGIAAKAISLMTEAFGTMPADLYAVIAPSAGGCCYEVDDYVREQFPEHHDFFADQTQQGRSGHYLMDLKGINRKILLNAGLLDNHIEVSSRCTLCDQTFFSYRRENGNTGRMSAFIMIKT